MSETINYDGRRFRLASTSTGDTAAVDGTIFTYQQTGDLVTCDYAGGSVQVGRMVGLVGAAGKLTIRFTHIYTDGRMASGQGESVPEVLPDGRIRLHETFTVFDSDYSGVSVVEEIAT
jgi:hypothetical protein